MEEKKGKIFLERKHHFNRQEQQMKMTRFGSVLPMTNRNGVYQLSTQRGSVSGFWIEIREDHFLFETTIDCPYRRGNSFSVILQAQGDDVVPLGGLKKGLDGIKNAIAMFFNQAFTDEHKYPKTKTVSVYADKGKGLVTGKFDYVSRQSDIDFPPSGTATISIMMINKCFIVMRNDEEVYSYQLTESQWKMMSTGKRWLGIDVCGNSDTGKYEFSNLKLNYIDTVYSALALTFHPRGLKSSHFVGNATVKDNSIVLIDGKDQTSACWFPIVFDKQLLVRFTAKMSLSSFEGFAFVFQNQGIDALGEKGKGKGYKGIKTGIAIEYSSMSFKELNDPYCSHVAIMCNDENGISNNHAHSIGYNEDISRDTWKDNKCSFEIFLSDECIVVWMNKKMMLSQRFDCFTKILKKKMFIGITASSSSSASLSISDFGIASP